MMELSTKQIFQYDDNQNKMRSISNVTLVWHVLHQRFSSRDLTDLASPIYFVVVKSLRTCLHILSPSIRPLPLYIYVCFCLLLLCCPTFHVSIQYLWITSGTSSPHCCPIDFLCERKILSKPFYCPCILLKSSTVIRHLEFKCWLCVTSTIYE